MQNILLGIIAAGVMYLCFNSYREQERLRQEKIAAENAKEMAALKESQDFTKRMLEGAKRDEEAAERARLP